MYCFQCSILVYILRLIEFNVLAIVQSHHQYKGQLVPKHQLTSGFVHESNIFGPPCAP